MELSLIIPAYNEAERIENTLISADHFLSQRTWTYEIIVVDDGSKDRSLEILKANSNLYSKLIPMPKNGGKGAAVQEGLRNATGDVILFQDADLEYDPNDYYSLLEPFKFSEKISVYGSRPKNVFNKEKRKKA